MRRVLLIAILALPGALLRAQPAARVDIYTPSPMVFVGDELRLAVAARTAAEQIVQNAPFTYTSSNAAILQVDARGTVRALRPGQANITVRSGNLQSIVEIMAAPKRIAVEPGDRELVVGERLQFSATAYDVNDNPIPNVAFAWSVTGANGNQINAATIASNGLLSTNGVAQVTVRANLNFASRADRIPPQLIGTTRVNVRPRIDYRVSRLAGTEDVRSAYKMRRVLANIAGNDKGQFVFRASLDGLSTCVVLYEPTGFRCIASAGEPRPLGGNIITPFGQPSINNRGDVLFAASGVGLMLVTPGGTTYPIQDGAYFGDYVLAGNFTVAKKSLNDYGDIVFAFNYRRTSDNVTLRALARLFEGEPEFIWSSDQPLPGLTGATVPNLEDWGIDKNGNVYFQAATNTGRAIFRAERSQPLRRLVGQGDANEGSTINQISGLQVAEDGSIGFLLTRQNGTVAIGRVRSGATAVETLRSTGNPTNPLAINAASGILFRGDSGQGYGLYLWQGATANLVVPRRTTPSGEAVTAFNAATLGAGGEVIAQAATAAREFVLFPARDGAATLLETGGDLAVSGRLHVPVGGAIVPGEKGGAMPRLRLGDVRSAYEIDASGKFVPKLVDLDMLPDNARFFGDGASFEDANGNLMFVVNNTIFRQSPSGIEMVLRNQVVSDDNQRLAFSTGIRPAINPAGAMALVAQTQTGERRIYARTPTGQLQVIGVVNATRVAGGAGEVITVVRSLAIDNLGRIMAQFDVRDGANGLYLWSGREWVPVAIPLATSLGPDQQIRSLVRGPLAGGNKFYLIANIGTAAQTVPTVLEFAIDHWTPILTTGDALPQGGSIATFGVFDVNDRGEVAVVVNGNTGGSSGLMLRSPEGNLRLVHQLIRPTAPDGDYLASFSEVDLRADGRVFFGSMTIKDAYTIFVADAAR